MPQSVHLVHTPPPVPASPIFTYGRASDPTSLSHDSSAESVTPKVNPKPFDNSLNTVPNLPEDPDSDPSSSDSSLPDLSDSSDDKYYKQRQMQKSTKISTRVKRASTNQSKSVQILQTSYIQPRINKRSSS